MIISTEEGTFYKGIYLLSLRKGRKISPTQQQCTKHCPQPMRNHHTPNSCWLINLLTATLPNFQLKPSEGCPSLCLFRLAYSLPLLACHKPQFLCYCRINFYLNKIALLFKVHNTKTEVQFKNPSYTTCIKMTFFFTRL